MILVADRVGFVQSANSGVWGAPTAHVIAVTTNALDAAGTMTDLIKSQSRPVG